jgi:ubiquinone/menaquinone biosynthesis C-methylase UbiE
MVVAMDGRTPSSQETWDAFFSDFYLRVEDTSERRGEAVRQAEAAAALTRCPPGGELLDVACGFGRHAVPLAAAGFAVTGVDRSRALLAEAERRAGGVDAGDRRPKLVEADYRELPFADASFDAALNLYTSLGYLGDEEDTDVLREIGRVLRPGGRLVIETLHRDLLVRELAETGWSLLGEGRLLLEQQTFDPASGVTQTTQTLIDKDGARESRTFETRIYTATELVHMLSAAGFAKASCYGDLTGGPFGTATRLVIVATR